MEQRDRRAHAAVERRPPLLVGEEEREAEELAGEIEVIQKWLGHAHITTTERYAHLAPTTGEDLIDLLERPREPAHGMVRKITDTTTNTTAAQTH